MITVEKSFWFFHSILKRKIKILLLSNHQKYIGVRGESAAAPNGLRISCARVGSAWSSCPLSVCVCVCVSVCPVSTWVIPLQNDQVGHRTLFGGNTFAKRSFGNVPGPRFRSRIWPKARQQSAVRGPKPERFWSQDGATNRSTRSSDVACVIHDDNL